MAFMTTVGLDLSLTASAAVAVPGDWDGRFARVRTEVIGMSLAKSATDAERALRTKVIASRIVAFCRFVKADSVWIEGYAFGAKNGREALGELGGVVRLTLVMAGFDIATVQPTAARKLLLGKLPRSGQKVAVQKALLAAGAPRSWSADEYDAMCVANWGVCETGRGWCFIESMESA